MTIISTISTPALLHCSNTYQSFQQNDQISSTVAVAAVIFLLFKVAIARSLYQNDVPLRESAFEPLLRLPSDGANSFPDPDAKCADVSESKPISFAVKADEQAKDIPDFCSIAVRSVPLTLIIFHDLNPINLHFPLRSGFCRFPCRHGHHLHNHPFFQPMKRAARISFGYDMMISTADEEGRRNSEPESWARSFRLSYHYFPHYHQHRDGGDDGKVEGILDFVVKHSHRFNKEDLMQLWHEKVDDDEDQVDCNEKEKGEKPKEKKDEEKEKGGFVKRIRKFLDNHF